MPTPSSTALDALAYRKDIEGRQHENRPHDFLIPISGSNYQQIGTRLEERSDNYRTSSRSGGGY